ncbi:DUF4062 domain-containing protein [Trueperella pecoris]|uniref:DUF4062 domain-containing protein n=1 Tax=Trueperella pecoris TaxID=2733571 RepID=UPI001ABE42E7|nr:DUF4062 domain-containing protein [Trueperella pecoris]QTG75803.1 DUF4062 domain-containing protein [Trueperella pecoris]
MSFTATVLRVAIASPSDVCDARKAVEKALHDWNSANSATKKVVLLPWLWETSSVPLLGGHPQEVINKQGIDSADILIAIFGSRLGAPTPDAVAGTVEEIERALSSKKPVHLYFSIAPLPNDIDTRQIDGLREFKSEIEQRGLYGEFATPEQLNYEIWKAVGYDVESLDTEPVTDESRKRGVLLRVQAREEREPRGLDSRGKIKYNTRHWYEVTNVGDADATNVTFAMTEDTRGVVLQPPENPITLQPGIAWKVNAVHTLGVNQPRLVISWEEDNERREDTFDVQ